MRGGKGGHARSFHPSPALISIRALVLGALRPGDRLQALVSEQVSPREFSWTPTTGPLRPRRRSHLGSSSRTSGTLSRTGRWRRSLHESLASQGHNVFIDIEIPPGIDWSEFISSEITDSDFFVVLLSKASTSLQGYVVAETVMARESEAASGTSEDSACAPRLHDEPAASPERGDRPSAAFRVARPGRQRRASRHPARGHRPE